MFRLLFLLSSSFSGHVVSYFSSWTGCHVTDTFEHTLPLTGVSVRLILCVGVYFLAVESLAIAYFAG